MRGRRARELCLAWTQPPPTAAGVGGKRIGAAAEPGGAPAKVCARAHGWLVGQTAAWGRGETRTSTSAGSETYRIMRGSKGSSSRGGSAVLRPGNRRAVRAPVGSEDRSASHPQLCAGR